MEELNQILEQQLDRLEGERQSIAEAIEEINRRYGVIDEAISWSLVEEEGQEDFVAEFELEEADAWTGSDQEALELSAAD